MFHRRGRVFDVPAAKSYVDFHGSRTIFTCMALRVVCSLVLIGLSPAKSPLQICEMGVLVRLHQLLESCAHSPVVVLLCPRTVRPFFNIELEQNCNAPVQPSATRMLRRLLLPRRLPLDDIHQATSRRRARQRGVMDQSSTTLIPRRCVAFGNTKTIYPYRPKGKVSRPSTHKVLILNRIRHPKSMQSKRHLSSR